MLIFYACLILAFTLLVVFLPLFQKYEGLPILPGLQESRRRKLREEKAQKLLALRELDFDYETGKVSKEDYVSMKEKLELETVSILKLLEEAEKEWEELHKEYETRRNKSRNASNSLLMFLIPFLLPLTLSSPSLAASVAGRILLVDESGAMKPLTNIGVRLSIYENGKEVFGAETRTREQGAYLFEKISGGGMQRFRVHVDRQGVPFSSETFSLAPDEKKTIKDIVTLPTTGDVQTVSAKEIVLVEVSRERLVKMSHSVEFNVRGSKTYDARHKDGLPLVFNLHPKAFSFQPIRGISPSEIELDEKLHTATLKLQIPPGPLGQKRIEFSYLVPYESTRLTFTTPTTYRRDNVDIVVSGEDYPVVGDLIQKQNSQWIDGRFLQFYRAVNVPANAEFQFSLRGLYHPESVMMTVVWILLAIVSVLGIAFLFFLPKHSSKDEVLEIESSIFSQIASLEDKVEKGEIPDDTFRKEKERYLETLLEVRDRAKGA